MLEGLTCVYRSNVDLFFYVVGSAQENEVSVVLWQITWTLLSRIIRHSGCNIPYFDHFPKS